MSGIEVVVMLLGILVALVVGAFLVVFLIVPIFKGIGWIMRQLFRFIAGEITDIARAIGALITALFLVPLVVGTVVIGRWSASAHYGRAFHSEIAGLFACLYRIAIGHPVRLVGLGSMVEGIERRLPEVMAAAPGADRPRGKAALFDGYRIVGSLPVGGSGARLYVAEPDPVKAAALERLGFTDVHQVVIKSFALSEGSSLPQIVRESRSLDAAKKMGLILDHELAAERFFYVMRYVPGESLTLVTRRLHAGGPPGGLGDPELRLALGYAGDVVSTLSAYHTGGLWHKDVKPDNIIVDANTGKATLVDFGLLSSLRSAMTLTTHGTEYFRDPELVRLALKGVKVHDVDGTKFDLYAAGAVLYSIIEDSFPAHGVLSQVSKRCPESVKWIIRRSMTDYDKRYADAGEMLADLRCVLASADPYALRPADLPSMGGGAGAAANEPGAQAKGPAFTTPPGEAQQSQSHGEQMRQAGERFAKAAADAAAAAYRAANGAFQGSAQPQQQAGAAAGSPKIRVTNWWTGASYVEPEAQTPSPDSPRDWAQAARNWADGGPFAAAARHTPRPAGQRRPAADQLKAAAARVEAARRRAADRSPFRRRARNYNSSINAGVAAALVIGGLVMAGLVLGSSALARKARVAQRTALSAIADSTEWEQAARDYETRRKIAASDTSTRGEINQRTANRDLALNNLHASIDTQARWDEIVSAVKSARGPAPAPETPAVEGNILVVCDLMQPLSDSARAHVDRLVASLQALHLTLHGNVPGIADPSAGPDAADVELTAQARLAVGQTPIDSQDARDRLAAWLADHAGEADVLVWVAGPADQGSQPRTIVFAPQPDGGSDAQAHTAALLQSVAKALAPAPRAVHR